MQTEFAPAKVNLTLHVTGQRADGYHLLDSLVCFADVGDHVSVAAADRLTLTIAGPQSAALPVADDNLVLRAARLIGPGRGAAITLEKVLPVSSGIGGGSADAAAALRALARHWQVPLPQDTLCLGADVPVCLAGRASRMCGIGEGLTPVALPKGWLLLVNPGVSVSTPAVFRALDQRQNPPMPPVLPTFHDVASLARFLRAMRNDMEPAATALEGRIGAARAAINDLPGCLLARMSGSGATCFGLFAENPAPHATALRLAHPDWWIAAAALRG